MQTNPLLYDFVYMCILVLEENSSRKPNKTVCSVTTFVSSTFSNSQLSFLTAAPPNQSTKLIHYNDEPLSHFFLPLILFIIPTSVSECTSLPLNYLSLRLYPCAKNHWTKPHEMRPTSTWSKASTGLPQSMFGLLAVTKPHYAISMPAS
jgi:hypothetical protein